jgi:hypothetical protein
LGHLALAFRLTESFDAIATGQKRMRGKLFMVDRERTILPELGGFGTCRIQVL